MDQKQFKEFKANIKPTLIEIDAYHPKPHGFYMDTLESMRETLEQNKTLPPVLVICVKEIMTVRTPITKRIQKYRVPVKYYSVTGCHRWTAYFTKGFHEIPAVIIDHDVWESSLTRNQRYEIMHYLDHNPDFVYDKGRQSDFWRHTMVTRKIDPLKFKVDDDETVS